MLTAIEYMYKMLGFAWMRTYPPLLTLPAGTELANYTETAMSYDSMLAPDYFIKLSIIPIINGVAALPATPSSMLRIVFKDSVTITFFGLGDLI